MKRVFALLGLLLIAPNVAASSGNNSLASELPHVGGGALMAAIVAVIADKYFPQYHRGWAGFNVSTAAGVLSQVYEYSEGTNSTEEALLDAASHAFGSAIGAYLTDQVILMPVVKKDPSGGTFMGMNAVVQY